MNHPAAGPASFRVSTLGVLLTNAALLAPAAATQQDLCASCRPIRFSAPALTHVPFCHAAGRGGGEATTPSDAEDEDEEGGDEEDGSDEEEDDEDKEKGDDDVAAQDGDTAQPKNKKVPKKMHWPSELWHERDCLITSLVRFSSRQHTCSS